MSSDPQPELDLGLPPKTPEPAAPVSEGPGLMFVGGAEELLGPAQQEFNKLLGRLEKARAKQERKRRSLDELLARANAEILPLIAEYNGVQRDIALATAGALDKVKFSQRRRGALAMLLRDRVHELLNDPVGITEEEIARLAELFERLRPEEEEDEDDEEARAAVSAEFEMLRAVIEGEAKRRGLDLDLSDMDPHANPAAFERELEERLRRAAEAANGANPAPEEPVPKRRRKPTKAQLERQRRQEEVEAAKKRDVKTLFKQLAKVLHPDIEPDPEIKLQREAWMKRLNAAFERRDLREMLTIEMEWLGEESSHLAQAGDDKLRIYSMVLKEQISELEKETRDLAHRAEYHMLGRFGNPTNFCKSDIPVIVRQLKAEIDFNRKTATALEAGGMPVRRMLNRWADEYLEVEDDPFPFSF